MYVITKQSLLASAATRYRDAHQRHGVWLPAAESSDAVARFARLSALPTPPTEEAIAAIVGDNRWTENLCDECGHDSAVTVVLGEEIHHPTDAVAVCLDCLAKAAQLAAAA
jgi:hypothetical protein